MFEAWLARAVGPAELVLLLRRGRPTMVVVRCARACGCVVWWGSVGLVGRWRRKEQGRNDDEEKMRLPGPWLILLFPQPPQPLLSTAQDTALPSMCLCTLDETWKRFWLWFFY